MGKPIASQCPLVLVHHSAAESHNVAEMRRTLAMTLVAACVAMTGAGCSGSDDEPDQILRIDGPAQVDDDVRVGQVDGDSTEG